MKCRFVLARLALMAASMPALPVGCSGGKLSPPPIDGGAIQAGDAGATDGLLRVELTDKMNFTFHSSLSAVTTSVRPNSDIGFDWGDASLDMMGRKLDPFADVDMMQLMLWRYTKDDFLTAINKEDLETGRLIAMGYCDTQHLRSNCRLADLVAPAGSPIAQEKLLEYVNPATYSPSDHVWVIMLSTGRVFGRGTRLLAFFQPSDGETNGEVRLTNDSTTLSYTVDLASLDPISLPQQVGDVVLGWANHQRLTKNGMGADWVPTYITEVTVAHYVGYTVADLERKFLLLQDLAREQYAIPLSAGQEVRLSRLTDRAGASFRGVDESGIWLFGLVCGTCRNPAPWFLSILRPGG